MFTETETTSLKASTDFATIFSCFFSLSVSIETLQALQGLLSEQGHSYAKNKAKEAEKACNTCYEQIERAIGKGLGAESKHIMLEAVELQKNTLYRYFVLDEADQDLVRDFIDKLENK
jgi:hypothetical protein